MRAGLLLLIVTVIFLGCDSTSSIENPGDTHFIRFYGQDGDQTGRDLVILPDGSLVLFGTTQPTTPTKGKQWYIARVDPNGQILWEREYGGPNDEEARDIELTKANTLVLVGNTYKTPTDRDILIVTMNLDSTIIDKNMIAVRNVSTGLPSTGDEDVSSVTEISDGFLISGSTTYVSTTLPSDLHDPLQVRVYANLQVYPNSWVQTKGNNIDDYSTKIIPVPAGGVGAYHLFGTSNKLPAGQTQSSYNFWLVILDVDGNPLNDQNYAGSASGDEVLSSVATAPLGYVLSGVSKNSSGTCDLYVAVAGVIDITSGFKLFQDQPLSLNLGKNLTGHTSIIYSTSGAYYLLGEERSFDDNQNWVLTKLSTDNALPSWSLPLVFGGQGLDECGAVKELPDGRLLVIGTMRTGRPDAGEFKMTLIKVSKDGKFE